MTTLPIELSDDLAAFVCDQVKSGNYRDAAEFVARVLERERNRHLAISHANRLLEVGEASGGAIDVDDGFWRDVDREIAAKLSSSKTP